MDPKENSGRLLEDDLNALYGIEIEETKPVVTVDEEDKCSGSDS